jgi:hypothetical protein
MSKAAAVKHEYDSKKDKFKITVKRYALDKKSDRKAVIKTLLHVLDQSSDAAVKGDKKRSGKSRSPIKETRLPETGD